MAFAAVQNEIADFLGALVTVYVLIIIAWVVVSFVFSMGIRVPYNRWSNAILDFLRDTASRGCASSGACPCGSAPSISARSSRSSRCRSAAGS